MQTAKKPTDVEQKTTVLVVEDDEGLNHLIRKALTREGYKTQQALTGSEAIASLIKDPNKILLLDYLLPDMTGARVIRAVREEKLGVPFIIMTGHGDEKVAVDMMKQGVRDYIVKDSGFVDKLPSVIQRIFKELDTERELAAAEKALRLAAKEWQMTFDGISDAICLLDPEMKITQCNNAMSKFLQKQPEEIIGNTCFEMVHCTREPIEDCPLVRMKRTKQSEQKLLQVEDMWLDIIAHPLFDEKGNITGAVHVISDITESKRYEDQIKSQTDFLQNVMESLTHPFYVINSKDYTIKMANTASGFKDIQEGTTCHALTHHQDSPCESPDHDCPLKEVQQTGKPVVTEHSHFDKDGKEKTVEVHGFPIFGNNGNVVQMIEYSLDITERRRNEVALRESEEKFRSLVENAPNIILIVDREGIIQFINHTVPGLSIDDVIGKNHTDFMAPEYHETVNKEIGRVFKTGTQGRYETGGAGPDGSESWYSSLLGPIMHNGKVNAVMIVTTDITDRNRAEEEKIKLQDQLQQAQKMEAIGQLAGGIAHDFNNLLGGISGYSDVLKIKMDQDSGLVKYVQKIQDAAIKAAGLTHQLLTFARKARVSMATVDIHNAIDRAFGILERTIDRQIEIERHLDAWTSTVVGDTSLIENALLNLAINARDAMPDGGRLTLATEVVYLKQSWFRGQTFDGMPGVYLKVSVADTGIGMDKATQAKVFEPFFTTKEPGKGTGLGLASVYGCVKQHNGYITVQSEPGKGSRFTLFLPLSEKAVEEAKDEPELIHGEGTVLVVDDEIIMREAASEMLTGLGYKVMSCANGFEAVECFRKNYKETDAVLLDMIMPKMNGIDCYRKLKEINPRVRVIIASGYSDEKQDIQIKELGVKDFIEKPFKISKLSRCIADLLAKGSE